MRPRTNRKGWPSVGWGALPSALLHIGIAALILLTLPDQKKTKAKPLKVPVEIVRPLETKKEKKKPLKKLAKKKPEKPTKKKPEPVPNERNTEAKPKPPEKPKPPAKRKPQLAEKVIPKPSEPKKAEPAKELPRMAEAGQAKPPGLEPKPKPAEEPLPEKQTIPKANGGGRKVKPKSESKPQISMIQRKLVGRWVLQPLKVNLKHRCGKASLAGVIELTKKLGNRFFGTLRTTTRWARCPAEGTIYKVVLMIRGNRVVMRNSGGGVDRGLIRGNLMVLKDPYGQSVWKRSR